MCGRSRRTYVSWRSGRTSTARCSAPRAVYNHTAVRSEQASSQLKARFPTHATTALCRTRKQTLQGRVALTGSARCRRR
eukprot:5742770-Prymnesium_polylepis.1